MADVKLAVMTVLMEEDSMLSGAITEIPGDSGGATRYGLARRWHPELASTTFYSTMSKDDALQVAVNTVMLQYADPLMIAQFVDQSVANKLLSYGVNENPERATLALQNALIQLLPSSQLVVDGKMGPFTIAAANRCMAVSLLNAFKLQMIERYAVYAKDNVLRGLIHRALD